MSGIPRFRGIFPVPAATLAMDNNNIVIAKQSLVHWPYHCLQYFCLVIVKAILASLDTYFAFQKAMIFQNSFPRLCFYTFAGG